MTCHRALWTRATLAPCGAPGVEQRGTAVRCAAHRDGWPGQGSGEPSRARPYTREQIQRAEAYVTAVGRRLA